MKVFFNERMVGQKGFVDGSPSSGKPAQVIEDWKRDARTRSHVELCDFAPVTQEQLSLAHDPAHVRRVLECRKPNGFGNKSAEVAASLPYTSGSMLAAALSVAGSRGDIACSPTSGFHHAGYNRTGGFCTFNGLVVTALVLAHEHFGLLHNGRIGILDCDQHYGDGTSQILALGKVNRMLRDHTTTVIHRTAGEIFQRKPTSTQDRAAMARAFKNWLGESIAMMANCDVVLYQAGADPHLEDPYGGFLLDDELADRDATVFNSFKDLQVPVAWNLAGGYQQDKHGGISAVLNIHRNTFVAAVAASKR